MEEREPVTGSLGRREASDVILGSDVLMAGTAANTAVRRCSLGVRDWVTEVGRATAGGDCDLIMGARI